MNSIKKGKSLAILVISGLAVAPAAQAKSFRDYTGKYTDKAKAGAESAWKSTKSGLSKVGDQFTAAQKKVTDTWDGIDPKTKEQIKKALIGTGVAVGTAAAVAGVGYAMSGSDLFKGSDSAGDHKELDEMIGLLSTDPKYKGDQWAQLDFLDQFGGLNYDEKLNILDYVEYVEKN